MNGKILIVEDESALITALTDVLKKQDFEILAAKDGKEGLDISLKEHPDLLLLDIIMPVMDGMTFLEQLRKTEWGKTANVIILTNLTDEQKAAKAEELGVSEYIIKADTDLQELVNKVTERLAND